jgi:hypothetical protein
MLKNQENRILNTISMCPDKFNELKDHIDSIIENDKELNYDDFSMSIETSYGYYDEVSTDLHISYFRKMTESEIQAKIKEEEKRKKKAEEAKIKSKEQKKKEKIQKEEEERKLYEKLKNKFEK